jgi:uncharacterized protein with von Willebrand factor type A (vWA) domain
MPSSALQVIGIGNAPTNFTTLEAIFVKRHEDKPIFDAGLPPVLARRAKSGSTC